MIRAIKLRERGATPRGMAKRLNAMKRESALTMARFFHTELVDNRFTEGHARRAGYARRSGKYTQRKQRLKGHRRPLEYSGQTRRKVRAKVRLSSTATSRRTSAKASYTGARKLSFRPKGGRINMQKEFRTITRDEAEQLAKVYDRELDQHLKRDNTSESRQLF